MFNDHVRRTLDTERMPMKKLAGVVVLTFLIGALFGGSMSPSLEQATASSNGQRVCVNKKSGAMRLASVKRCARTERSMMFGASGAIGASGPQGPAGPTGPKGDAGVAGPKGEAGSSASLKTKTVNVRYTSATPFAACGDGTSNGTISAVLFEGITFDTATLTNRFAWNPVFNCSITLTVIDP